MFIVATDKFVEIVIVGQMTTIENVFALEQVPSLTLITKCDVPPVVGVPLIIPVVGASERPAGNAPVHIDHNSINNFI